MAKVISRTLRLGLLFLLAVPAGAATSQPDRTLYQEARQSLLSLNSSPKLQAHPAEWEKVVMRYRRVVARYPQSSYCGDALLAVGDLYREMARRFSTPHYNDDAVKAYRTLVEEYPRSRLGEQALFNTFEIAGESADKRRLGEAGRAYLEAFPHARRAAEVRALLRRGPAQASLPAPPPPGLAQVFKLRFWSGDASTRIVIDVEREVAVRQDRIAGPDRLWVDLLGARLHPTLKDRTFAVGDGLLEKIRIAQNKDDVVRVVLDFKDVKDHSVFYLQDPSRLVIDVRGTSRPQLADGAHPSDSKDASDRLLSLPTRRLSPLMAPDVPDRRASRSPGVVIEGEGEAPKGSPERALARAEAAPLPPQVNRAGSYSIARQLGLGARKIVIDPGHGGHDPGCIGAQGLQEKDLVLDVALRLEKLVRSELKTEVIMTRSTDAYVPLEERTAIANSKGADLFLSIHANSSRNPTARGIETYFLNFATDPHAQEVAARENAISAATLKDLQGLVKAIALNGKVDESRDFATSIQEAMVSTLRGQFSSTPDRGVHTAPFYVLIGANMPSILAEIAFLSHPSDEKLLRSSESREMIARSLLEGVRGYLEALNRNQTRQLTSAPETPRVMGREVRLDRKSRRNRHLD